MSSKLAISHLPASRKKRISTFVSGCMCMGVIFISGSSLAEDISLRQTQMNAVEQYYLRDGIHLDKAQITAILDNKPEIVNVAMEERNVVVQNLIGTGGGHLEVNGEGTIRQNLPVINSEIKAGAYVHTPSGEEAVLGYHASSSSLVDPDTEQHKAVWGITKGGDVYGELGSTYHRDRGIGIPPPPAIDNAYGVFGVANDPDATNNYGVYGISNKTNGVAVYGKNTNGQAGYFEGPVGQDNGYGGVVKAGAYVLCGSDISETVKRSFAPAGASVQASRISEGRCTINFGFEVLERFFQATAEPTTSAPVGVSCIFNDAEFPTDETRKELICTRYDAATGTPTTGHIMVTIY